MPSRPSRIDLLELDIDLRLADLWREAASIEEWSLDVVAAFMRAAYGKAYCHALTEELPAQTEWSEKLDAAEVAGAMDDAWLVCLPSRSEGLPRVALEGACRGRAIIGGNRAGILDVVHDGENGLVVPPLVFSVIC